MIHLFIHRKFAPFLAALLIITSCQKVIVLPIDDEEQVFVFEGVLKDRDSTSFFKVSKTVGIYGGSTTEPFSGATISVQDENAQTTIFTEKVDEPGTYVNYNFTAVENMTYSLTANLDGVSVTATTFSKSKPVMDSIYSLQNPLNVEAPFSQWIFYHSTDPVDEENYYRLRIWKNGKEPSQYYIGNDYYINGETYEAQFFGVDAFAGDTIHVEFLEMDPEVYDYIYGLSNTLTTGPFSPAPSNPPTNLDCPVEIHGYFGVYMTDTASMIVQ